MASESNFIPARYWEERLTHRYGLDSVGYIGLGLAYNRYMYAVRRFVVERAIAHASLDLQGAHILDIGSGTGFYVDLFGKYGPSSITGVDVTNIAVQELRKTFPQHTFYQRDIAQLQQALPATPPLGYDLVSVFDVLFHVVDDAQYEQAVANIGRLTRPGGYVLYAENLPRQTARLQHFVRRARTQVMDALSQAELEVVATFPMFVLMNSPSSSDSSVHHHFWNRLVAVMQRFQRVAGVVGAALFPIEKALLRWYGQQEGPCTSLLVLKKKGIA